MRVIAKIYLWFKDLMDPEDKDVVLRADGKLYDLKHNRLL